jgi:hypothetical protein
MAILDLGFRISDLRDVDSVVGARSDKVLTQRKSCAWDYSTASEPKPSIQNPKSEILNPKSSESWRGDYGFPFGGA